MFRFLCLLSLTAVSSLKAFDFHHPFNHSSLECPITRFTILGERCSGTNFLTNLIKKNIPTLKLTWEYGWKHFPLWTDLEIFNLRLDGNEAYLEGSDDCMFIMIVRDPYDWIRSLYLYPHHVDKKLRTRSLVDQVWRKIYPYLPSNIENMMRRDGIYKFISSEWKTEAVLDQNNPYQKRPFRHLLELRKYKIMNMLQIGARVKNFVFVRYEDLNGSEEDFVHFLFETFQLKQERDFFPIYEYKQTKKRFKKRIYPHFFSREFSFINREIDWEIESLVGYNQKAMKDVN